jgi:hypothetical protein
MKPPPPSPREHMGEKYPPVEGERTNSRKSPPPLRHVLPVILVGYDCQPSCYHNKVIITHIMSWKSFMILIYAKNPCHPPPQSHTSTWLPHLYLVVYGATTGRQEHFYCVRVLMSFLISFFHFLAVYKVLIPFTFHSFSFTHCFPFTPFLFITLPTCGWLSLSYPLHSSSFLFIHACLYSHYLLSIHTAYSSFILLTLHS